MASLFLLSFVGHAVSGWKTFNQEQKSHYGEVIGFGAYLKTGSFGESVFENWESEFLQMGCYVALTACLVQRGSAESKKPDNEKQEKETIEPGITPWPVRKGGAWLKVYRHSLSTALLLLFLFSFLGHAFFGMKAFNSEAQQHGEAGLSMWGYLGNSQFWFESFQNWQSEFLSIAVLIVLSIWLREKDSPESKPVAAPHRQTGD